VIAKLLCVGGGILIGVGVAWTEAVSHAELKYRNKYEEQLEIHKRVLERAHEEFLRSAVEAPVETEEDLSILNKELKVGGEITVTSEGEVPDYVGTAALYADPGTFAGHQEIQAISYIDPEDYEEDDGRAKEQITIFMTGDGEPIFVMDGEQIDNWADLVGEHILVDFYKMVPPSAEDRVLFVRNNIRDEDYEVSQVSNP
jgi:hypothetical protein